MPDANEERLTETHMLAQAVTVHIHYGDDKHAFCAIAGKIIDVHKPPDFDPKVKCLHLTCTPVERAIIGEIVGFTEMVIPLDYVTYIGIGPEFKYKGANEDGERVFLIPEYVRSPDAMTEEEVEIALRELGGTIGQSP